MIPEENYIPRWIGRTELKPPKADPQSKLSNLDFSNMFFSIFSFILLACSDTLCWLEMLSVNPALFLGHNRFADTASTAQVVK